VDDSRRQKKRNHENILELMEVTLMKQLIFLLVIASSLAAQTRSVALSWNDPQPGVTYNVYRSADSCPAETFAKINPAPVTAKTYADADIAPGRYCYYVTAEAAGLESDPSNKAQADAKPFSPDGLSVVVEVVVTVSPDGEVVARMNVSKGTDETVAKPN
jgi:hypothetical protein